VYLVGYIIVIHNDTTKYQIYPYLDGREHGVNFRCYNKCSGREILLLLENLCTSTPTNSSGKKLFNY
jgi:hypothetical protein